MKKLQFLPMLMLLFLAACEKEQPTPATAAEASALEFREEKVTICHEKGNGDRIVLNVSASSVEAHLAHGDELGDCTDKPDICEEYGGGIVFYLVPEGEEMDLDGDGNFDQGLIAATADHSIPLSWYDAMETYPPLSSGDAADWFLPTKEQLNEMWIKLADGDGNDINVGLEDEYNCGGFASANYWSSTEDDGSHAWFQNFYVGNQGSGSKYGNVRVRAVRAF